MWLLVGQESREVGLYRAVSAGGIITISGRNLWIVCSEIRASISLLDFSYKNYVVCSSLSISSYSEYDCNCIIDLFSFYY